MSTLYTFIEVSCFCYCLLIEYVQGLGIGVYEKVVGGTAILKPQCETHLTALGQFAGVGWWCGCGQAARIHTTILIQASHRRWRGEKLPTTNSYTRLFVLTCILS